ncbi:Ger(x)C family spore germination protein [Paenibacillus sp. HWE-109]|uniref:Ger(x)C family spore germination protein n=1 Tax=Paenibacillus sp. HWE-109 TaxID=1306526 RepID=UPI001EE14742|nr:Ger(x)C family spore germination protein [Paenibacillus sp. HWE-109]UKS30401.1 Ger(x)C family spore germination protein [Paenibacillus sp. HWE-109]
MSFKRIICLLVLIFTICLLTGCWDRVEINERGFVVGVAIDFNKGNDKHKYEGTYQVIVPAGLKQSNAQSSSMSHGGQAFFNIATTENSMPAVAARMSSRTSRSPYFEHLKVIIVSSEIAKSKNIFPSMMDFFLRNSEMRRGVQILIADGQASDILNIAPNNEATPVDYISSIAKNIKKSNYMLPQSRIGDVHEKLIQTESFVIQTVKKVEDGITLNGAALFDGVSNQLLGFLNGEETQGLNFITEQVKGGVLESIFEKETVGFKVEGTKRKFIVEQLSPDHFKFIVKLSAEGVLDKSIAAGDPSETETLDKLQKSLEELIVKNANKAITRMQHTYKKDALGMGAFLYQNHYKIWKPIADNWDQGANIFAKTDIEVQAKVTIRRVGNIFQSSKER